MSRMKRFLNMYREKLNPDGTIKPDYRQKQRAKGLSEESCDAIAREFKEEYEELKALDETDPEPWIEYTAWDLFSEEEKKKFNPDGTLKPEYIRYAHSTGISDSYLAEAERRKKIDVENYNKVSARFAERGINFGESQMRSRFLATKDYVERQEQLRQDIRNGEEISSLELDVEPDDYYQQHGYDSARHG